jgi:hypothetical protein
VADASDTAVLISDGAPHPARQRRLYPHVRLATEEVAGRTPIALLAPQMSEEFVNIYRTELRAGQPVGREEIVVGKNGQRYWAKVISNPILDADGRGATRCPC